MEINDVIRGKVIKVSHSSIIVKHKDYTGFLHISDISDYFIKDINTIFKVNDENEFIIKEIDEKTKRLKLGWKQITPRFLKNPFEFKLEETKNGFTTLKREYEELEND